MLAQTAYLKVTRLSLRPASNLSKRRVEELNSGIGELRQLLSCVVCCQLLVDPYSPKGKRCQHNVCRLCLRGKKHLFPSCTQCEGCSDFKTYEENRMMGTQLLCYKTLCVHLLHSALFGQLAGMRPQVARELVPRIKLPPKTTQEFIREGSNISDTFDTFLPQPDLPFLKDMPTSLPAETPPTTAATTPELPYDHHLNISDIEAEAAATAEQGHFSPLPLLPTGSRMGLLSHAGQIVIATESSESGFMEQAWTDQVDLSGAVSKSNYTNSGNNFAVSYVMPTSATTTFDPQELQIGQVVQMAVEETVETSSQLTVLSTTVEEIVEESVEESVEETAEETVETSTQLEVLTSAEEPNEISDQLTELEVAVSEEGLVTVEEAEETSIQSEVVAEHKEEDQQLDVHTSQSPTQAEMEEAVEEHVATKTQLGQVQTELQVEEPLQTDIKDAKEAAEEAKEKDQHPSSAEQQKEDIDEPTLKRKRTRSLKASQAAKIEPAPSEVKAKVQSGKGALRRVRGKDKEEKVKPPKPKCRCGISGSSNTLTTCRNSRCPCYKSYNSCAGCHCVCCKNPHKEDYVESDEDDDFEDFEMLKDVPEPMTQSEEPVVAEPRQEENSRDCAPPDSSEEAISLVPLNNLQHSQHPLVLVQNEQGDYQGFNIFQGNKPLDPVAAGFTMRVQLQHTDGNGSVPQHAYMMPPITMPNPPPPSLSPPPPPAPDREVIETPAKKFRTSRTRRGRANFSALDTVDELVSGGSRSNSAAGDRSSATDNAQSLFEEIMSGSDDL